MKTTANVWLLPTEKSLLHVSNNKLIESIESTKASDLYKSTPHHLYINIPQSDLDISKIKEGDWVYLKTIDKCGQIGRYSFDKKYNTHNLTTIDGIHYPFSSIEYFKKIIATTDESLVLRNNTAFASLLPSIPQSFIEHYITEFNKGNVTKQVEVELEEYDHEEEWSEISGAYETYRLRLKLNRQNEISIIIL